MITITITKTIKTEYKETVNYLTKETPTEIVEETSSYGNTTKKEIKMIKEYATEEATKTKYDKIDLLNQTVEDDSDFNLVAVIKAINNVQ